MGALTLKSFPFELRGWDIEKFESIDPTDGFGINTRVYISKQQIVQIEPDHSEITSNPWLSDKGRQFFDGIFNAWTSNKTQNQNLILKKESWQKYIKTLLKTLYLFEHCTAKTKASHFLTIVIENLGIETLSLLKIIEQKYSFIKLRRAENLRTPHDLETDFQISTATNPDVLKSATLCLLVANNPRYEGHQLNLKLRQRYLKGNFKCLLLGSTIDLTFPTTSIGTNLRVLKKIVEGNSFACQDIRTSTKPLVILSNELHKRIDNKTIVEMFKTFQSTNIFNQTWNGLNTLSPTLYETGMQSLGNFLPLTKKDFNELSSFYFINVNAQNVSNLKKIAEIKLLDYNETKNSKQLKIKELFLDQNSQIRNNQAFSEKLFRIKNDTEYTFLPVKMFYENEETFLNAEGLVKRTSKLITRRKTRENWKLLRNLFNYFKNHYTPLNFKSHSIVAFNLTKQTNFSNFLNFHYSAIEKLDNQTPSLTTRNHPFFINQLSNFKQKPVKLKESKSKYWLDDFFTGGKDTYSKNSLVLSNCSKIVRTQSTNFF